MAATESLGAAKAGTIDGSNIINVPGGAGVTSINARAGAIVITDGSAIGIVEAPPGTFTINNSGVFSVNGANGNVLLVGGVGITITEAPAGTFTFDNTAPLPPLPPTALQAFTFADDFMYGTPSGGPTWGEFEWNDLGAGTIITVPGEISHPGIINFGSPVIAGTHNYIFQVAKCKIDDVAYIAAVVRPQDSAVAMGFTWGCELGFNADETGQGVYFSFQEPTSPFWRTVTRDGGGITVNTTAVAYAVGTWYLLEALRIGATWQFSINGVVQFTHAANVPTGIDVRIPQPVIRTDDGGFKSMDIDLIEMKSINPLGSRF